MNANRISCPILYNPTDPKFAESIRQFQGCPTVAVTPKGRIYMGWYAGGWREPHMDNYSLLVKSDDGGKTWSDPLIIIPSSKELMIHTLDIQLWTAPDGKLHLFWVQNNVIYALPGHWHGWVTPVVEEYYMNDITHAEWVMVCDDPDADEPRFSEPRCIDKGFMRCKPTVLESGRHLYFNYAQDAPGYEYSITDDGGKTFRHMIGPKKIDNVFDEGMAYQKKDGSVRLFLRTETGRIGETVSYDEGETWTEAKPGDIVSPATRFYVSRTPSGNVLLVRNDHDSIRKNMTVCLSEDDGETWKYQRCIDEREGLSYPDADFYDGKIYLTYDRERMGAKEILFTVFTEDDLKDPAWKPEIQIVSKP